MTPIRIKFTCIAEVYCDMVTAQVLKDSEIVNSPVRQIGELLGRHKARLITSEARILDTEDSRANKPPTDWNPDSRELADLHRKHKQMQDAMYTKFKDGVLQDAQPNEATLRELSEPYPSNREAVYSNIYRRIFDDYYG